MCSHCGWFSADFRKMNELHNELEQLRDFKKTASASSFDHLKEIETEEFLAKIQGLEQLNKRLSHDLNHMISIKNEKMDVIRDLQTQIENLTSANQAYHHKVNEWAQRFHKSEADYIRLDKENDRLININDSLNIELKNLRSDLYKLCDKHA